MTNLPVCKLCGCEPNIYPDGYVACKTIECQLYRFYFDQVNWQKLMYVPAKKEYGEDDKLPLFESEYYVEGYNAAIDDMLRDGEI